MSDIRSASTPFKPGAPAPKGIIPLCAPEIRGNEWKYIKECLDTNWVSSAGSFVGRFERMVADYLGAGYAVATVNGTSALHLAMLVAGVGFDDEVLLPALTFVASANAVSYTGARPVFIDVDPDYRQIDIEKTADFLKKECRRDDAGLQNKTTGRRVKAIMPVHLLGHPVDLDPLIEMAEAYNLRVIEDNAESLGAKYLKDRGSINEAWSAVGAPRDISCLSFNGNKIITTGGGGMLLTNDEAVARRARYLSTQAKDESEELIHSEVGYNYRLTNIQAAMGVAQMESLDKYVGAKRGIAERYREGFDDVDGISPPAEADWAKSTFWLNTVLVDRQVFGMDSRALLAKLREAAIETRPFWQPLHTLKPFADCFAYRIEAVNRLHRDGLSLPSSVGLGEKEQAKVIGVIRNAGRV